MSSYKQGRIATLLQRFHVPRPGKPKHVLSTALKVSRYEAFKLPRTSSTMTVYDDYFVYTCALTTANCGVNFLGIEAPSLLIECRATVNLGPNGYTCHTLHIAPYHYTQFGFP
jgi:hypothetical protein